MMRAGTTMTILAAIALASCGGGADQPEGNATQAATPPISTAFTGASPTPLPTPGQIAGIDYDIPPDVARHVARQERCAHWRGEAAGGTPSPEVARGLQVECRGIDAELDSLRRIHDADPKAYGALRTYDRVEG